MSSNVEDLRKTAREVKVMMVAYGRRHRQDNLVRSVRHQAVSARLSDVQLPELHREDDHRPNRLQQKCFMDPKIRVCGKIGMNQLILYTSSCGSHHFPGLLSFNETLLHGYNTYTHFQHQVFLKVLKSWWTC